MSEPKPALLVEAEAKVAKGKTAEEDVPLVKGEVGVSIGKSNAKIHEFVDVRLTRFMIVTAVAGLILAVALGYQSIRMQFVIDAAQKEASARVSETTAFRKSQCDYTRRFVGVFQRFEQSRSIAAGAQETAATKATFVTLFSDLSALGVAACAP